MSGLIHVCLGGRIRTLRAGGRTYRYEDNRNWTGPVLVRKDGEPCKRQPNERSPFWDAYEKMRWRERVWKEVQR